MLRAARPAVTWDGLGQVLSALCIGHCVGLPLVLALLPAAVAEILEGEAVHQGLIAFVVFTALLAFLPGYRVHQRGSVVGLAVVALTLLVSAAFLLPEEGGRLVEATEMGLTLGGGVLMAIAHWRNRALCRACCEPRRQSA
ncbi:MAG TPA: MerC domain-containing protein [Myxococcaceae bacterium]|jgi:peptidoglycan/LPS O-acetylase OafA/YrhL